MKCQNLFSPILGKIRKNISICLLKIFPPSAKLYGVFNNNSVILFLQFFHLNIYCGFVGTLLKSIHSVFYGEIRTKSKVSPKSPP